ncbi:MAG: sigma-70 family RNA polymerase sigma factor [Verrucomicrobia bacterium]|nr:sigma-70 family RNA polymerase sigma factor [Verrucomicrobiota bacterium]
MNLSEQAVLATLMQARTRLSAAAWLVVRDTHAAEDIFQNVALKAMTREVTFESEAALISWALVSARREGIDWLRRRQRESVGLDAEILDLIDREWQVASTHPAGIRIDALRDCLAATPESARHLLRLRYFDGHSCEEVAQELGIGLNAIYKRVSRLHESLKECIEAKLVRTGGSF